MKGNYKNGKIYRIVSPDGNKSYIGSTCKKFLSQRFSVHRCGYKKWKNGEKGFFVTAFELFEDYGIDNCFMVLVEDFPCDNVNELNSREGYWIRHYIDLGQCVNKSIMGRTKKEYRENNKEHLRELNREWRSQNRDVILKKKKEYRENNKEKVALQLKRSIEKNKDYYRKKKKEYYEKNKDSINRKNRDYALRNKEKLSLFQKEWYKNNMQIPVNCICGKTCYKRNLKGHEKTQTHLNWMEKEAIWIKKMTEEIEQDLKELEELKTQLLK